MITTAAQLEQALEQIQRLCQALDSLRTDILPKNPKNFAIMAEGPVDEIRVKRKTHGCRRWGIWRAYMDPARLQ